ncbi:hypothetical protein HWV00_17105 [Moritella sp. 24]|uniref:hypothetical protein n=1 Tax=Moritella sp. 24 TaxID=2746230 RepID=UPI001BAA73B3|nr:hypothetical protein [Moritella sp. 24]QUM77803.1 hypothetical protein HWV00_17105 [Moritella sp. 24]
MNKREAEVKFNHVNQSIKQAKSLKSAKSLLSSIEALESIGEKNLQRYKLINKGCYPLLIEGLVVDALNYSVESQRLSEFLSQFEQCLRKFCDRELYLKFLNQYLFTVTKLALQEWLSGKKISLVELSYRVSNTLMTAKPQEKARLIELRKFEDLCAKGFKSEITVQIASQVICLPLSFNYEGYDYSFDFSHLDNENAPIKSEGVVLEGDIHGLNKQTLISIKTNKCIQKPCEVIRLLNYFIKAYRVTMNEEWVLKISDKLIVETNIRYTLLGEEVHRIIFPPQGTFSSVPKKNLDNALLLEELKHPTNSIWKHSYLDAKLNFGINNLTQAVMDLNIAFENFVGLKVDERLSKSLSQEEVDLFYSGRSYENLDSKLQKFITKDIFENEFLSDKNYKLPPSTYKLVGYCNRIKKFSLSRKDINSLINTIRTYRNDIAHGRHIADDDLFEHIPKAFESFDSFQALWD